jgi:hypothetical protein
MKKKCEKNNETEFIYAFENEIEIGRWTNELYMNNALFIFFGSSQSLKFNSHVNFPRI